MTYFLLSYDSYLIAQVAQLVEHFAEDEGVASSSLALGTHTYIFIRVRCLNTSGLRISRFVAWP